MQLSLAMIVRDEEAHLGRCLDSVRGLVDEAVVVDTGSCDGTAALARRHGARVFHSPWAHDFSAARNVSLGHALGDWVLVLDADEAIDPLDHPRIRAAMERPGAMAYRLLIRSYLPDGAYTMMDTQARANPGGYAEGAAFPHCGETGAVRLFRRLPWVQFRSRIHEQVDPCFLERGLPLPELEGVVIHHFGFTLGERVQAKKPVYLDLARRDAGEHPEDRTSRFNLLIQAATAEDWPLALEAALACRAGADVVPATVVLTQALALQRLDRHNEALAVFAEVLTADPNSLPAALGTGVSLERLGRREEARAIFEACIQARPDATTSYLDLADLCLRAGDPGGARAALRRGLAVIPRDPSLWERLVRLGLEHGETERAVQDACEAIGHCPQGGDGSWHNLVGVFLLRQGAADQGRQIIELGLQGFPGHPGLTRLRELC